MAHAGRSHTLPWLPLVAAYRAAARGIGALIESKPRLTTNALETATDDSLAAVLNEIAANALPVNFHADTISRRIRLIRHALNHLLRATDPVGERITRCVTPGEAYFVAGLGCGFWSAVVWELSPTREPRWCPATERGLQRLGLLRDLPNDIRSRYEAFRVATEELANAVPQLSRAELADFLERVSRIHGRELPESSGDPHAFAWSASPARIENAIRHIRTQTPLRARIRSATEPLAQAIGQFQHSANAGDWLAAFAAFREAFPDSRWETALPELDDAYSVTLADEDRARLWCEVAAVLRSRFRVHPLELADVVVAVVNESVSENTPDRFAGFCSDSFAFLAELTDANRKEWMTANRDRYQFVLREPLVELCEAVAERYVQPVLNREHGWDLECDAKTGRAITSICKNDYGRGGPYQPVQWITFYRKSQANKRADAQFFVRISADGAMYGFHLGRTARDAGKQFRRNIQEHAEAIFAAMQASDVFGECAFWAGDELATQVVVKTAADLRAWAVQKTIAVGKRLPNDSPLLRRDELVGEVLLTFDRLLPAFACAAETDPRPLLAQRAGSSPDQPAYSPATFHRDTFLSEVWLERMMSLLRLKKQLVLQGVPGTGKTHVARCLARLLTHDRADCVRLVQFHPAYSYEEFVEGIRARGAEVNGRNEVTFPVEDGVLCAFAEQAAKRPSEPHVLIVDELNRGNLPRIFGELLYLLEYRDQAITLPYSKREFRLPENLFVLATMNPLDRSAVALDHALRRRFSFVDMPADAAILASWLESRESTSANADATFGPRVALLFEELNRRLARELGPDKQIGHSFFMVPELDENKLAAVWEHHVRPLLLDYLGGREDRLKDFSLERFLGTSTTGRKRKPATNTGE